tara:strand:- start:293 stop:1309 length:1017 start_codon:yes stop_codon:yes gene_type:complete
LKKSELKKIILEALTPDEATKVDSKYKEIYSGMLKGKSPLKLKNYDNPDAMVLGRTIKLVQKESKLAKESKTEKQRKWACAQVDSKSRPKGLSKAQAKEMCSDTNLSKNESMENTRLQELIKSALKGSVKETTPVDEDKDWIQKAIKRPGALHRALDIPQDEDIPKSLIDKDIKKMDKKEDEEGKLDPKDLRFLRQLDLAKTLEKFNEDKVKGSNVRKDTSDGDWEVVSGKTGKPWPQDFKTKKSAKAAIRGYHASQNESLAETIFNELRGNVNEAEPAPEKKIQDIELIKKYLPKINTKKEYLSILNIVLNMGDDIPGITPIIKKQSLLAFIKTLGK